MRAVVGLWWCVAAVACSDAAAPAVAVDADPAVTFAVDAQKLGDSKGKDAAGSADGAAGGADGAAEAEVVADAASLDEATASDAAVAAADEASPPEDTSPTACMPQCAGKNCGTDGCGGSCGECTDKQQCQVGKCVTKPNLGCGGLLLKENWTGKFKGECTFVGAGGLVPIKSKTSGDMTFAIKCFNSKYLVSGKMDGEALEGVYIRTSTARNPSMSSQDSSTPPCFVVGPIPPCGALRVRLSRHRASASPCGRLIPLVHTSIVNTLSGNKFTLTLGGTYDPGKLKLTGTLTEGTILLWNLFTYKFEGPIEGTLGATGTFDGTWQVDSTDVQFLGQPSPTTPPFKASGTWSASGS